MSVAKKGWLPFVLGKKKKKSNCVDQKKFKQGKCSYQIQGLYIISAHKTVSIHEEFIFILRWWVFYSPEKSSSVNASALGSFSLRHWCLLRSPLPCTLFINQDEADFPLLVGGFHPLFSKCPGTSYLWNSHTPTLKMFRKHVGPSVTTCLLTSLQGKGTVPKSRSCPFSQSNFRPRLLTKRNPVAFLQVNSSLMLEVGLVCKDCPMQIRADEHLTNLFTDQSCWAGLSDFLSKQRTILYGHLVVPELVV